MISLIERMIHNLDIESITKDVMSKLVVDKLDMFFVIHQLHDSEHYELIGMTYSKESAKKLAGQNKKRQPRIIQFHIGKLLKLVEDMGAVEEVE